MLVAGSVRGGPARTRLPGVGATFAGPVVALKVQAGAIGFLVVVLLCIAAAGIFTMMSRSLKRLGRNVASGEFHGTEPKGTPAQAAAAESSAASAPVAASAASVPGPRGAGSSDDAGSDPGAAHAD
jgi:hypothetical protein